MKHGWWCRIESSALDSSRVRASTTNRLMNTSTTTHKMADGGHSFGKKTFHKPTYCHHCSDLLWGLIGQGYICEGKYIVFQSISSNHINILAIQNRYGGKHCNRIKSKASTFQGPLIDLIWKTIHNIHWIRNIFHVLLWYNCFCRLNMRSFYSVHRH